MLRTRDREIRIRIQMGGEESPNNKEDMLWICPESIVCARVREAAQPQGLIGSLRTSLSLLVPNHVVLID